MKSHLYIRIKAKRKSRPFCEPVWTKNHKLKAGYALVDGVEEHHQEGVYHLRYLHGGETGVGVGGIRSPGSGDQATSKGPHSGKPEGGG
jgi:hypothetical protein